VLFTRIIKRSLLPRRKYKVGLHY